GLDGRKMSKSYNNTIPLFAGERELKKVVMRIPTDSTPVEAPKDPDGSTVFRLLEQFAVATVTVDVRGRLEAGGMGWGELKNLLFEVLNQRFGALRERYEALMEPTSELDDLLAAGAERARARAKPVLSGVREAIGITHPNPYN
ncbi:MAG: tryptophan--tRNA ligase, partial [Candidatus Dormibacteraceae bacterium]